METQHSTRVVKLQGNMSSWSSKLVHLYLGVPTEHHDEDIHEDLKHAAAIARAPW